MVICAAPGVSDLPIELSGMVDALYWKALPGFDFSAYAIAITETARASPGADLLVMNDSVFGPFGSLADLWPQMRWDLTGFTASGKGQNHLQSYAFYLKCVDKRTASVLAPIVSRDYAFDNFEAVLLHQETRLAEEAAKSLSVGALWYADPNVCADPSLFAALPLIHAGFPFLKKSLLTKHQGIYTRSAIIDTLRSLDHPFLI